MTDEELEELLRKAKNAVAQMPPSELKAMQRQQAISFARGNLALDGKDYSEEFVAGEYDELHP